MAFVYGLIGVVAGGLLSLAGIVFVQRNEDRRQLLARQQIAFSAFLSGIFHVRTAVVRRTSPHDDAINEDDYKTAVRSAYEALLQGYAQATLLCGSEDVRSGLEEARQCAGLLVAACLNLGYIDHAPQDGLFHELRKAQLECVGAMQVELGMARLPSW